MQHSPTSTALQQRPFVIIGAGGLGCPAILGLIASGIEDLTVVDPDTVEISNLQRQILYRHSDHGRPKSAAAHHRIYELKPTLKISTQRERILPEHSEQWVANLPRDAVILECSDDPELKFAVNDASVRTGRSCIIGGVIGTRGHVMAIQGHLACFRCIFEEPPPANLRQDCNVAGILSSAAGVMGYWMAHFAILALSNESIGGTLLTYDLLHNNIRRIRPQSNPDCSICSHRFRARTERIDSSRIVQPISN